ncbi:hypothetical protein Q8A67_002796 [Cirrhinus molitorella]|uniref:Uncharacterized protein n=1 Tax=Cirrhinus molitorella TaxID=172907 RepID=A0AA88Q6K3_9TELE|nr:hypothetical protein Q8A67_002796 [Cirrhinus molitorella]
MSPCNRQKESKLICSITPRSFVISVCDRPPTGEGEISSKTVNSVFISRSSRQKRRGQSREEKRKTEGC